MSTKLIIRWLWIAGVATACCVGCQTDRPGVERYPLDTMLDPVTEEVPDVRTH